jgi:phosphoribosylformylglycinamidine synthase
LITTLLELCFSPSSPNPSKGGEKNSEVGTSNIAETGMKLNFDELINKWGHKKDLVELLFSENIGVVVQPANNIEFETLLAEQKIEFFNLGTANTTGKLEFGDWSLDIPSLRDTWFNNLATEWLKRVMRITKTNR